MPLKNSLETYLPLLCLFRPSLANFSFQPAETSLFFPFRGLVTQKGKRDRRRKFLAFPPLPFPTAPNLWPNPFHLVVVVAECDSVRLVQLCQAGGEVTNAEVESPVAFAGGGGGGRRVGGGGGGYLPLDLESGRRENENGLEAIKGFDGRKKNGGSWNDKSEKGNFRGGAIFRCGYEITAYFGCIITWNIVVSWCIHLFSPVLRFAILMA